MALKYSKRFRIGNLAGARRQREERADEPFPDFIEDQEDSKRREPLKFDDDRSETRGRPNVIRRRCYSKAACSLDRIWIVSRLVTISPVQTSFPSIPFGFSLLA